MRRFVPLVVFLLAGCSGGPLPNPFPAKKPTFDNVPALEWPGEPAAEVQSIPSPFGEQKEYTAMFTDRLAEGLVTYTLVIHEYPADAMKTTTPKELIEAAATPTKRDEVSRKEVTHGSKKYPGLEIRTETGNRHSRHVMVFAGVRLYSVSVSGKTEAALTSPAVEAFFASFVVD